MRLGLWAGVIVCGLLAAQARAEIHNYNFTLDGSQEVGPVATPGTGTAFVTLDDVSKLLTWNITYSGLQANSTAAHFHGPAAAGVIANIRVGLSVTGAAPADNITMETIGATSGTFAGSHTVTNGQRDDILAGLWYVNIHTTAHSGGEIRGQVVPEPASLALLLLGGAAMMRRR